MQITFFVPSLYRITYLYNKYPEKKKKIQGDSAFIFSLQEQRPRRDCVGGAQQRTICTIFYSTIEIKQKDH